MDGSRGISVGGAVFAFRFGGMMSGNTTLKMKVTRACLFTTRTPILTPHNRRIVGCAWSFGDAPLPGVGEELGRKCSPFRYDAVYAPATTPSTRAISLYTARMLCPDSQ
jgi:hypothetical protein